VIGWTWEGAADGGAARGVSDDEDRAREAAEAWLRANPGATAVLSRAHLADGTTTLSAFWARTGHPRQSRRGRDGRITWARVPAARQRAAG
jgi:hypothetical protein